MNCFKQCKLLLAALLLVSEISCKKADVNPPILQETLSTDLQKSASAAISYNYQIEIDLTAPEWFEINSCTGEHLRITSGLWQIIMHGMHSDHAYLFSVHNNIQNYKLVSLETGMEYTGNSEWNFHYNFPTSNPYSFTGTLINSVMLTTAGGGNNSRLNVDLHITVNPDGTMTASVDNFRSGCQ